MRISDWSSDVCSSDLAAALARIPADQAGTVELEVTNGPRLRDAIRGHDMVLSAAPYTLTPVIAEAARDAGAHYFDLTEDVESTRRVKELAVGARTAFVPQCGLAPGFIPIVAYDLAKRRSEEHTSELQSLMRISYAVFCL